MSGFVKKIVPFDPSLLRRTGEEKSQCRCVPVMLCKGSTAMSRRIKVIRGNVTFCIYCGTLTGRKQAVVEIDGVSQRLGNGQAVCVSMITTSHT